MSILKAIAAVVGGYVAGLTFWPLFVAWNVGGLVDLAWATRVHAQAVKKEQEKGT